MTVPLLEEVDVFWPTDIVNEPSPKPVVLLTVNQEVLLVTFHAPQDVTLMAELVDAAAAGDQDAVERLI